MLSSEAAGDGNWRRDRDIAVEAARAAGTILLAQRGPRLQVAEKADRSLVTGADLASEAEIIRRIHEAYPDDEIIAEEGGRTGAGARRQWIVDPLDGSTNFSRGLPFFAVSIALRQDGIAAVAAVFLPVLGEMFAACRHGAATLNEEEIRVSSVLRLSDAMINVYFDRHGRLEEGLEIFDRVARRCEGRVKTMGSTASLLCYVACGRLDGVVKNATKIWDFAAGALILEQAGGRLGDFAGSPLTRTGQSLVASNGHIHRELSLAARGEGEG